MLFRLGSEMDTCDIWSLSLGKVKNIIIFFVRLLLFDARGAFDV